MRVARSPLFYLGRGNSNRLARGTEKSLTRAIAAIESSEYVQDMNETDTGLNRYLREIGRFSLLTPRQEIELALAAFCQTGRGRAVGCVPGQPAFLGDKQRGVAG